MNASNVIAKSHDAELLAIAAQVFWWGTPEDAVACMPRFLAHVMTFGDWRTVQATLRLLGEESFRKVLEDPPPGIFDMKSWNYWHLYFHKQPLPALPSRAL
jgi:hypothetical protein